jgi:hypothetical protein
VRVVPNLQYSWTEYAFPLFPPSSRQVKSASGIRIVVEQTGTVGTFSFRILLVQLVVSLGLLVLGQVWIICTKRCVGFASSTSSPHLSPSSSQVIMDFVALYVCPTGPVLRQYKERVTGDLKQISVRRRTPPPLPNPLH